MKLLCLNLWGGRRGEVLLDYLTEQSKLVDIFCFQEVFDSRSDIIELDSARMHLFEELQKLLFDFHGYFSKAYGGWVDMKKVDFQVDQGQAIFVRKGLEVSGHGKIYICGDERTAISRDFQNEPKILEYCTVAADSKKITVANAHGKWYPGDKTDTPERLAQSQIIKSFLEKIHGPKILCGDFNLDINTKSVAMFEPELRNLIKDYKIVNTRNKISWENYHNKQYFSDFVFASPNARVKNFEVPYNLVSDHLPLTLDFEIM